MTSPSARASLERLLGQPHLEDIEQAVALLEALDDRSLLDSLLEAHSVADDGTVQLGGPLAAGGPAQLLAALRLWALADARPQEDKALYRLRFDGTGAPDDLTQALLAALPAHPRLIDLRIRGLPIGPLPASLLPGLPRLDDLRLVGCAVPELPDLGAFSGRILELSGPRLKAIHPSLFDCTALAILKLEFGAGVALGPQPGLTRLRDLAVLRLIDSGLGALPEGIGALQKLQLLTIRGAGLKALPAGLSELPLLTRLNLDRNELSVWPELACPLTSLRLSRNRIPSAGFEALAAQPELTRLELPRNPLEELPRSIRSLKKLEVLHLSFCQLDELPEWLPELTALEELDVRYNRIQVWPPGLVPWLRQLPKLRLNGNPAGALPE